MVFPIHMEITEPFFCLLLGADRWSLEQRFVQNYSVDNEDSKRALPSIFTLSFFFLIF